MSKMSVRHVIQPADLRITSAINLSRIVERLIINNPTEIGVKQNFLIKKESTLLSKEFEIPIAELMDTVQALLPLKGVRKSPDRMDYPWRPRLNLVLIVEEGRERVYDTIEEKNYVSTNEGNEEYSTWISKDTWGQDTMALINKGNQRWTICRIRNMNEWDKYFTEEDFILKPFDMPYVWTHNESVPEKETYFVYSGHAELGMWWRKRLQIKDLRVTRAGVSGTVTLEKTEYSPFLGNAERGRCTTHEITDVIDEANRNEQISWEGMDEEQALRIVKASISKKIGALEEETKKNAAQNAAQNQALQEKL